MPKDKEEPGQLSLAPALCFDAGRLVFAVRPNGDAATCEGEADTTCAVLPGTPNPDGIAVAAVFAFAAKLDMMGRLVACLLIGFRLLGHGLFLSRFELALCQPMTARDHKRPGKFKRTEYQEGLAARPLSRACVSKHL